MEGAEERVLHDTAPNSDQEEEQDAQGEADMIANSPTLMNHNVNMNIEASAEERDDLHQCDTDADSTENAHQDTHIEPMDQLEGANQQNIVSGVDPADTPTISGSASSPSHTTTTTTTAASSSQEEDMLCCANIRINSPHFFTSSAEKTRRKQERLTAAAAAETKSYQSESSIGACSTSADSSHVSVRHTQSLSCGSSPSLSGDSTRPLTPVTHSHSISATDKYSTKLSINTKSPASSRNQPLLLSAPELNEQTSPHIITSSRVSSAAQSNSRSSPLSTCSIRSSVSVPTVNTTGSATGETISSHHGETTPAKICHRSNTLPANSTTQLSYHHRDDQELSASHELLLKRKSEAERELASPGKRVRGLRSESEATSHHASMILNIQNYNTTQHTQYGHIHVSPQHTPSSTRRRNSYCKSNKPPPPQLDAWLRMFTSWDSADKTYALNQLIDTCDAAHVRHIMAVIEPQFQRDFISLLPKELALYVLSFLSPKDLLRAGQTCQYWRTLTEDTLLWRQKCKESGADLGLTYKSTESEGHISEDSVEWKSVYLRAYTIEHHWRHGEVKPTKILRGHDDHVITCLEFCGNRIVSGSDDNTLKVWDVESGQCLRTLVGHTGGVWSSQMKDNIVISGSTDRTLRVWDTESGDCLHTLHGHTSTVRCMHLHNNIVVSGSRDATLRMWDIHTGECVHVLMGHVAAVRCVQYDGTRVVSGAYDYTVRVWDPATESCIHVLQGHTNRVYSLQFDGKHIVSGSLDTSIRVWDADSGECLHTLTGHQSLTSGMEIQDGLLVSGNADSTVKVWDINTGACLQTLTGARKHQGAVTCLQFTRKFVVTSSDDGTVKLWSLQTGEFIRNLVSLESGGSGGVVWRVKADNSLLVCASGSRNGTEDTKLIVIDFGLKEEQEEMMTSSPHSSSHASESSAMLLPLVETDSS